MRVLGPFYSSEVLPPFLAEQALQTCWASHPDLLNKPLKLAGQASQACWTSLSCLWNKLLETWWASLSCLWNKLLETWWASLGLRPDWGPMWKDGPYLRWACGCPGLANGPIGPIGPYFIIYPLQLSRCVLLCVFKQVNSSTWSMKFNFIFSFISRNKLWNMNVLNSNQWSLSIKDTLGLLKKFIELLN